MAFGQKRDSIFKWVELNSKHLPVLVKRVKSKISYSNLYANDVLQIKAVWSCRPVYVFPALCRKVLCCIMHYANHTQIRCLISFTQGCCPSSVWPCEFRMFTRFLRDGLHDNLCASVRSGALLMISLRLSPSVSARCLWTLLIFFPSFSFTHTNTMFVPYRAGVIFWGFAHTEQYRGNSLSLTFFRTRLMFLCVGT